MLTNTDIKCMLLERYLNLKKNETTGKNELLSLYVQIMNMTYDLIEKYGIEIVDRNFIELFDEDIIYFDKKEQVQYLIDHHLLDNIIQTNQELQNKVKLQTVEEELKQSEDITMEDVIETVTENITNTAGIVHEEIDNLVTTTVAQVEQLKTSSLAEKVKTIMKSVKQKLKQLQGNLSHCFGGGATST